MSTAVTEQHKPATVSGWKKAAVHYPLCPSGVRIGIRIPDLPALIEAGEIPQHLLELALGAATGKQPEPSVELAKQLREYTDALTMRTVVDPVLKEADLVDIPYEDKEFIVAVATRQRDIDAEGEHIAGLSKSERFRRFRGLGEFDPTLEGA